MFLFGVFLKEAHFTYQKKHPGMTAHPSVALLFFVVPASWSSFHSVHSLLPTTTEASDSVVPSRRPVGFMMMLKKSFYRQVDHCDYVLS